jgi:hypothetical protein
VTKWRGVAEEVELFEVHHLQQNLDGAEELDTLLRRAYAAGVRAGEVLAHDAAAQENDPWEQLDSLGGTLAVLANKIEAGDVEV